MRRVNNLDESDAALERARSEAQYAFGNDDIILERLVEQARHVEVQVFGDKHGNVIHLGERDCSMQRRHQKVFEESPCPVLPEKIRVELCAAAVKAAQAVHYDNAGTVEFLLAPDGAFYFLEMNTRIQVEHPVTEAVTGIDLVAWQLRVARGEKLPMQQAELSFTGHAIEARVYAENPHEQFLPQTGLLKGVSWPELDGVRVDTGYESDDEVTPFYDPMLAKIIAWGETREVAVLRLEKALTQTALLGVTGNLDFLQACLRHKPFLENQIHTTYVEEHLESLLPASIAEDPGQLAVAAVLLSWSQVQDHDGWGSNKCSAWPLKLSCNEQVTNARVHQKGYDHFLVEVAGTNFAVRLLQWDGLRCTLALDGKRINLFAINDKDSLYLQKGTQGAAFHDVTYQRQKKEDASKADQVTSPMSGKVLKVLKAQGNASENGETLIIVEAMKLEHQLTSPRDGVIAAVHVKEGDQVGPDQLLMELEPQPEAS